MRISLSIYGGFFITSALVREEERMRIYYRDFMTMARRWTYGKPVRVRRDGPMDVEGLVCRNLRSELWIPEYLLEPKGRQIMAKLKEQVKP